MHADTLVINESIAIAMSAIEITAVRAQGPGGQNVNKVSSAVQLRFDITTSDLPEPCKTRLLKSRDSRITKDGVIVIKAREFRSQDQNREAALERLKTIIRMALIRRKRRVPTKPKPAAKEKRLARKTRRGRVKTLRSRVVDDSS